jgi:hypothetical protein
VTPLFDKVIEGFAVIFHQISFQSVGLSTLQSRAVAGLASGTFIFCLPGSTGAVKDGWDKVISFQLDSRHKPCNGTFGHLKPRNGLRPPKSRSDKERLRLAPSSRPLAKKAVKLSLNHERKPLKKHLRLIDVYELIPHSDR